MEVSLSEVRDLLCKGASAPQASLAAVRQIVICDRGWVFIGHVTEDDAGLHLTNASVVRRWGTTNGIGELAISGPLKDTKLDPCGSIRLPGCIGRIDCVESKWAR